MAKKSTGARQFKAEFHFVGAEDSFLLGTVLLRDGEMVLELGGSDGPYQLVGKMNRHWYEGTNTHPERQYDVKAAWAEVGDLYIGRWVEEGYDYLFSFDLRPAN